MKKYLIVVVVVIILYYLYKKKAKKESDTCDECTQGAPSTSISKSDLIKKIVEKNKSFIQDWARQFGLTLNEIDLTWLEKMTLDELEDILELDESSFKERVIESIAVE